MTIRRALFWCSYVLFFVLSIFAILAPRPLLERLYVFAWSWVLLVPVVWWLVAFIRALYRGGE